MTSEGSAENRERLVITPYGPFQATDDPGEEHLQGTYVESQDHTPRVNHMYRTSMRQHQNEQQNIWQPQIEQQNIWQHQIEQQSIRNSLEMVTVYERKTYEIRLSNPDYELNQENCWEIVAYVCEFVDARVIPLWDTISIINPYTIRFEGLVSKSKRARNLQYKGGHHDDNNDKDFAGGNIGLHGSFQGGNRFTKVASKSSRSDSVHATVNEGYSKNSSVQLPVSRTKPSKSPLLQQLIDDLERCQIQRIQQNKHGDEDEMHGSFSNILPWLAAGLL